MSNSIAMDTQTMSYFIIDSFGISSENLVYWLYLLIKYYFLYLRHNLLNSTIISKEFNVNF